jgi:hypothetical protein
MASERKDVAIEESDPERNPEELLREQGVRRIPEEDDNDKRKDSFTTPMP